jgi:FecR protein
MSLVKRVIAALLLTGAAALLLASSTLAQERVGVVTNIEGFATVARVALPEPRALQFKDALFLRDRITTGERSLVRVLLGGKATVTARERSVLTITEVPGVATINLGAGRIAVAVAKGLMKPGQVIEIRTPNAVTAIRGTVVIAEVSPIPEGHRSTITILRGLVDVTKLDPTGSLMGPAVNVGALERVMVVSSQPVPTPEKLTRDTASALASDFSLVPKNAPAASVEALSAEVKSISLREALQVVGGATQAANTSGSGSTPGSKVRPAPSPPWSAAWPIRRTARSVWCATPFRA